MQPAARWRPVGTILVDNGSITRAQLDAALAEQSRSGRKIGEILISTGAIDWLTLAHAIAEQAQEMNELEAPPVQVAPPPPPVQLAPPPSPVEPEPHQPAETQVDSAATTHRLREVEALLKERQRAFLDLVSVTETLRATLSRLQDELATKNEELARLRARG